MKLFIFKPPVRQINLHQYPLKKNIFILFKIKLKINKWIAQIDPSSSSGHFFDESLYFYPNKLINKCDY
ncbi:hypothetical protein FORC36_4748 (plasmid) [Vibrio vulnificus]|nr:hypothetical protein FORC36_4748 [Vibrio vulnificus]